MSEHKGSGFTPVIRKLIEKSLFTERQIEILLNSKDLKKSVFGISRGAYYRQTGQSRTKLVRFYYTVVLLRGLGVLLPDDMDVMSRLAEQVSMIQDSDVVGEQEDEVLEVIDKIIQQASKP